MDNWTFLMLFCTTFLLPAVALVTIAYLLKKAVGIVLTSIVMLIILVLLGLMSVNISPTSLTTMITGNCSQTFSVGQTVKYSLTNGTPTRLRARPEIDSSVTAKVNEGTIAQIIGGPTCNDGLTWWNLEVNGLTGWTAEFAPETGRLLQRN